MSGAHHLPGGAPVTHASLWLQTRELESESPAAHRQETFSPSKAEMLARLKSRQIEKRVASAAVGARPDGSVDGPSSPVLGASGYMPLWDAQVGTHVFVGCTRHWSMVDVGKSFDGQAVDAPRLPWSPKKGQWESRSTSLHDCCRHLCPRVLPASAADGAVQWLHALHCLVLRALSWCLGPCHRTYSHA